MSLGRGRIRRGAVRQPKAALAPTRARSKRSLAAAKRTPQDELLARLKAVQESLRNIPSRDVDALIVVGRRGAQVVTLQGGESAYRMLVEAMSEGAATVTKDGTVLYCNGRFAELVSVPAARVVGMSIQSLFQKEERDKIENSLRAAQKQVVKAEFSLRTKAGRRLPAYLSMSPLRGYRGQALGVVLTDLTEQKLKHEQEVRQAEAMHRLLLERELAAQEGERKRIARELHDEAGQLLTSLLVGLRSLEDAGEVAACKSIGKRLREITAHAIDEIGRLARGLHPIALDDHGLGPALSRYVAEYAQTHGIAVQMRLDELNSLALPAPVQIALYRILQETLTNVARHARAKTVRISFRRLGDVLEVSVADDGGGFDTGAAALPSSDHLGLRSIRERAVMLGGIARFISGKRGTRVLVQIPLLPERSPARARRARG